MVQQLDEMGTMVVSMIRTVMESFARRDLSLCMKLPELDDPVDRLNRRMHLEALKLADDPRSLDWGMHMNLAARALERVGDNAVDIAEQVELPAHRGVPRVHRRIARGPDPRMSLPDAPRILVVEDEDALAESVRYNLEREGFAVAVASRRTPCASSGSTTITRPS